MNYLFPTATPAELEYVKQQIELLVKDKGLPYLRQEVVTMINGLNEDDRYEQEQDTLVKMHSVFNPPAVDGSLQHYIQG